MRHGCWNFLIRVSEKIRQRIEALDTANTNDLGPKYWAVIWEIATTDKEGGLEILARRILKFVIPGIEEMYGQSQLVRRLDKNTTQALMQVQPPTHGYPNDWPRGSIRGGRRGRPRKGGASAVTHGNTARAPRRGHKGRRNP